MILDDNEIEQLARKGAKITDSYGKPIKPKSITSKPDEVDYLRIIAGLLERILAKPDPQFPSLKPPDVIVKPPEVIVKTTSVHTPKQIRQWKFVLTKDWAGRTTQIIATAVD